MSDIDDDDENNIQTLKVNMSPKFKAFLDQRADMILREIINEIDGVVDAIAVKSPDVDNPLGRFTTGQSLIMNSITQYKYSLETKLSNYLVTSSINFMSNQAAKQMLRERERQPAGIS